MTVQDSKFDWTHLRVILAPSCLNLIVFFLPIDPHFAIVLIFQPVHTQNNIIGTQWQDLEAVVNLWPCVNQVTPGRNSEQSMVPPPATLTLDSGI